MQNTKKIKVQKVVHQYKKNESKKKKNNRNAKFQFRNCERIIYSNHFFVNRLPRHVEALNIHS